MSRFLRGLKSALCRLINFFVPTRKNRIYARATFNSYHDRYDILNCNSSNLLRAVNALALARREDRIEIVLAYYDRDREPAYAAFARKALENNVRMIFIPSRLLGASLFQKLGFFIREEILRYSSALWLTETASAHLHGKLPWQREVCCNYFITNKNDYLPALKHRWEEHLEAMVTTSQLAANMLASSLKVPLHHCLQLGFPRNDVLAEPERGEAVFDWITEKIGHRPKFLFVYLPTVRDEEKHLQEKRPLLGYEAPFLADFLKENDAVLVYKPHPYQNTDVVGDEEVFLPYPARYDFSLYDVLSVSDCLIGDYSSVNFDYLLRDKPIIFDLYDLEQYKRLRGLSYDPYEFFCPGDIVTGAEEMRAALESVVQGRDGYAQRRSDIRHLFFKDADAGSTARVTAHFNDLLKGKRTK